MSRFKVGDKIKELAYGIDVAGIHALREKEARTWQYARLMPTPQQVEQVKKEIGIGSSRRRK